MSGPLVVVGDTLLDVDLLGTVERSCPDAPAPVLDVAEEVAGPGGAGLAAVLARRLAGCRSVRLVTAVADDVEGRRLRALLDDAVDVVACGATDTSVKCRLRAPDRVLARVDCGRGEPRPATADMIAAIEGAGAVLVSDYGLGLTADAAMRQALTAAARRVPVVWDPHPRGSVPVPGVAVATPNVAEAMTAAGVNGDSGLARVGHVAGLLRHRWAAVAVAVTVGARGAMLVNGTGSARLAPAPPVVVGDPCGAGDAFAAVVAGQLLTGADVPTAVSVAVRSASRFLADCGVSALRRSRSGSEGGPR